jgi:ubiquinol-cytochrome c reductase cytochrome c subunit
VSTERGSRPGHGPRSRRPALRRAAVAGGLAAAGAIAAAVAAPPPAQIVLAAAPDGSALFDVHCIACHGPDGRGIENLGLDLVASAFVAGQPQAELVGFLRAGRLPDDPDSVTNRPMPSFGWLTDGELRALAAFLKSRNVTRGRIPPP